MAPFQLYCLFVSALITAVRVPLNPFVLDFPTHHGQRCSEDTIPLSQVILKFCLHTLHAGVVCRAHSPHRGLLFAGTKRRLSCCAQQHFKAFPHFVGKFLQRSPEIRAAVQTVKPNPRHLTKCAYRESF